MKGIFVDNLGLTGVGVLAVVLAVVVGLTVGIVGFVAYANEQGCQQKADAYDLENADYKFWADTCFVDLDERTVNVENVRENSRGVTIYTPDIEESK